MLLCDFHIHTTFSDGSVDLRRTVDLFGQSGFDVIAITDHIVAGGNSLGRLAHRLNYSLTGERFDDYLSRVREEGERAWKKYGMLVIPGVEISKNHFSSNRSAHLLVLDIKEFISAEGPFEKIFLAAKRQDTVIVACHPHHTDRLTEVDTLYLWNNREKYSRWIDAWEIANRDDVFAAVGLKKYPYIANSDFHKPRHLYSWKTLLNCEKNVAGVKQCLRDNRGVAITLFKS